MRSSKSNHSPERIKKFIRREVVGQAEVDLAELHELVTEKYPKIHNGPRSTAKILVMEGYEHDCGSRYVKRRQAEPMDILS